MQRAEGEVVEGEDSLWVPGTVVQAVDVRAAELEIGQVYLLQSWAPCGATGPHVGPWAPCWVWGEWPHVGPHVDVHPMLAAYWTWVGGIFESCYTNLAEKSLSKNFEDRGF